MWWAPGLIRGPKAKSLQRKISVRMGGDGKGRAGVPSFQSCQTAAHCVPGTGEQEHVPEKLRILTRTQLHHACFRYCHLNRMSAYQSLSGSHYPRWKSNGSNPAVIVGSLCFFPCTAPRTRCQCGSWECGWQRASPRGTVPLRVTHSRHGRHEVSLKPSLLSLSGAGCTPVWGCPRQPTLCPKRGAACWGGCF